VGAVGVKRERGAAPGRAREADAAGARHNRASGRGDRRGKKAEDVSREECRVKSSGRRRGGGIKWRRPSPLLGGRGSEEEGGRWRSSYCAH